MSSKWMVPKRYFTVIDAGEKWTGQAEENRE
jgi:hypothetical protein